MRITDKIDIDENEIQIRAKRSSGPGGQNVNKVSTAIQLRFDVAGSPSLPAPVRQRLSKLAGNRMTKDGVLIIEAQQYRTQEQNRQDAVSRFSELVRQAAKPPRPRRKTKPSRASRERRLATKRRRSEIKHGRRPIARSDE